MENANDVIIYDTARGKVTLSPAQVKAMAVGGKNVTDAEVYQFMQLCLLQQLNPFLKEAYLVKYGDNCSMLINYDVYKQRAENNLHYLGRESGIVVMRGLGTNCQIINKPGTCLYPSETLIGGWCRVSRIRETVSGPIKEEIFREVALKEYSKSQAKWNEMPSTMIEKVAVSQALRNAFPTEYAGMRSEAEIAPDGSTALDDMETISAIPAEGVVLRGGNPPAPANDEEARIIMQEDRKALFAMATEIYGKPDIVKQYSGMESTANMSYATFFYVMKLLEEDKAALEKPEDGNP